MVSNLFGYPFFLYANVTLYWNIATLYVLK